MFFFLYKRHLYSLERKSCLETEKSSPTTYLDSLFITPYSEYVKLNTKLKPYAFWVENIDDISLLTKLKAELIKNNKQSKKNILSLLIPIVGQSQADVLYSKLLSYFVFRSYQLGKWIYAQETKDALPYFKYIATMDSLTCPSHAALHGLVLPVDDPFWDTHMPPTWDWNCRCEVVQIAAYELRERGNKVLNSSSLKKLRKGFIKTSKGIIDIRPPKDAPLCIKDVRMPTKEIRKIFPLNKDGTSRRRNRIMPFFKFLSLLFLIVLLLFFLGNL